MRQTTESVKWSSVVDTAVWDFLNWTPVSHGVRIQVSSMTYMIHRPERYHLHHRDWYGVHVTDIACMWLIWRSCDWYGAHVTYMASIWLICRARDWYGVHICDRYGVHAYVTDMACEQPIWRARKLLRSKVYNTIWLIKFSNLTIFGVLTATLFLIVMFIYLKGNLVYCIV